MSENIFGDEIIKEDIIVEDETKVEDEAVAEEEACEASEFERELENYLPTSENTTTV